jgi:Domain of unknown function (DUF4192)
MTTPPAPLSAPNEIRIDELGELIAGIPGLLGFVPTDSLVLATFSASNNLRLGPTVRVDLPPTDENHALVRQLRGVLLRNEVVAATTVIVGGGSADPPDLPHRELNRLLTDEFADLGVRLAHSAWVERIEPDATWWCYEDDECGGRVHDPRTSVLATLHAIEGNVTYASRTEMTGVLAPDDEDRVAHRAQLLAAFSETEVRDVSGLEAELMAAIEATDAQDSLPELTDEQIVRLVIAMTHQRIRDSCLVLSTTARAVAAERLWTVLTRAAPVPERAEPACLLALCAYLRGSAVLAGMALEVAMDADPHHRMAPLLREALDLGTPPDILRRLLATSMRRAGVANPEEEA